MLPYLQNEDQMRLLCLIKGQTYNINHPTSNEANMMLVDSGHLLLYSSIMDILPFYLCNVSYTFHLSYF